MSGCPENTCACLKYSKNDIFTGCIKCSFPEEVHFETFPVGIDNAQSEITRTLETNLSKMEQKMQPISEFDVMH
jgi:hypothetical protein